ncbi:hypothetical protein C0J52_26806 [Blattella germanica]|nr:hypothetical protein C0J52_26806 [Blattella germanica]
MHLHCMLASAFRASLREEHMCIIKNMEDNPIKGEDSSPPDEEGSTDEVETTDEGTTDDEDSSGLESDDESMGNAEGEGPSHVEEHDESDEDEVVRAIREEREKQSEHPPDIVVDDLIGVISFHPKTDMIAVGTFSGDVILYKYTNESTEILNTLEIHLKVCRDMEFSEDGNTLYSCSKDRSITLCDVNTGLFKNVYDNAHEDAINCLLIFNDNMLATGDDNGIVKLWDTRKKDAVCSFKEVENYVHSMVTTEEQKFLVYTSGDGTLTSVDLNTRKLHIQSESYEHELTSLATMKNETKLLVSSSNGINYIFNWGEFGYHSDEFPGPKRCINRTIPVTENVAVCGDEDGLIRAIHLFPHSHLGIVGQHKFPIESLDISCDGQFIASSTSESIVKFWNIKYFESVALDAKKKTKKKLYNYNLPSSKCTNASDFFSGLS